jgi:hypothetical protein
VLAVARIARLRCTAGHVRRERAAQRTNGDQKQDEADSSRAGTTFIPLRSRREQ